ncbi:MAG: aminomethyl-transferring glycine dehydrogenase, partial [Vicinamibacterales bacterium]
MSIFDHDVFQSRHIGPDAADTVAMLSVVRAPSLDALIDEAIPARIRLNAPLDLPLGTSEHAFLRDLRGIAAKNRLFRSYIGLGYYDTITPSVILRNVLENPGWYTPYTPYQAEIAQGRLEALLNYQTMVAELTGMEISTASLLDEATAAGEAMTLLHRAQSKRVDNVVGPAQFFVADSCYPQTIDVLKARAEPLGIELVVGDLQTMEFGDRVFGALVQSPDESGVVHDLRGFIARANASGVLVAVASDLLSLTLLTPPGEVGADIVLGNSQRFGVPMGYGGPHAAFFATKEKHIRQSPGRIIGVSMDVHGHRAYRMALQTREQHIRREKATSNICTAQALLANIAGLYAAYHGPKGLTAIAQRVHSLAALLAQQLAALGLTQLSPHFFDTIRVQGADATAVRLAAESGGINLRYRADGTINIALDEMADTDDVARIVEAFQVAVGKSGASGTLSLDASYPDNLARTSPFLTHPVFNTHHSEMEMMRYIRGLERKDIGLDTSMIALGSCTMKLNAASEMLPITWPEFSKPHPFVPVEQVAGYHQIFAELEHALSTITGFAAVSLQPNSGAQGEFAGLMVIRAYHLDRGDAHRDVVLIPASAHGTNPASAVMAGMRVVVVNSTKDGNIDVADLKAKAALHKDRLSCLMVTYPSTHGVFEESIQDICATIHEHGGQVYMDGANMNAQVGLTSPAAIGADVCHLNLHKTFAIPHGGGGPGMGPIAVAAHLAPYLPGHAVVKTGGAKAIHALSAAPWSSASILLISFAYIRMLGADGMTNATRYAILN